MKRCLVHAMVLCGLLVFVIPAWSLTITDVGSIDQLLPLYSVRLPNSGYATELKWLRDSTGDQTLTAIKYDTVANDWVNIENMPNVYALELQDAPAYFFIKIGVGGLPDDAPDHFLFENFAAFNYAVVDIASTGFTIKNVGKISHIGEGGGTPVPEPSTMLLLGSGLVGLVGYGRRRRKKSQ